MGARPLTATYRHPPEPIEKTVVRVEIVNRLLSFIQLNRMAPGSRLPSEHDLTKMLGVSRPSLREATSVLEASGLLEVRRGIGSFVKDPGAVSSMLGDHKIQPLPCEEQEVENLAVVIHEIRMVVEPEATALAAQRATSTDLERIDAELTRLITAARSRDIIEVAAADVALHAAIVEASGSSVLLAVLNVLEVPLRKVRERTLGSYWDENRVIMGHRDIVNAIHARDREQAYVAARQHLHQVEHLLKLGSQGTGQTTL